MSRFLAAALALPIFYGCVIVEDGGKKPEIIVVERPVPVPIPYPGSGTKPDPGTDVLWLVRLDRGTANLAGSYEAVVNDATQTLLENGVGVRTIAVASLHEGTLLWANGPSAPAPVSLATALRQHAAGAPTGAVGTCTTSRLATLAGELSAAQVSYSVGSSIEGESSVVGPFRPFASQPSAFLVAVLDSGARPYPHGHSRCEIDGKTPAAYFGDAESASWLRVQGESPLTRAQTRFLLVGTGEGVGDDEVRARCLEQGPFPPGGLDAIGASPARFFEAFGAELNARAPTLSTSVDFCRALVGDWPEAVKLFARAWAAELATLPPVTFPKTPAPPAQE